MQKTIRDAFEVLPAIAIDGPKAVGKTWIAKRLTSTHFEFDNLSACLMYDADPAMLEKATKPLLIDEWQKRPGTWDDVRRLVDNDFTPTQYLLTGSAYPKGVSVHSGAGRIVQIRLHPLSLEERLKPEKKISLADCLAGSLPQGIIGECDTTYNDYAHEIVRSGFPAIYSADERARPLLISGYIDNIISKESDDNGYSVRKPDTLRRWLTSYASAVATSAGYGEILDNATAGERDKPVKSTALSYRDMLASLRILEELEPWLPAEGNFNRLKMTPTHFLTDPALEASLLGIDTELLLAMRGATVFDNKYGNIAGRLFESLVCQSVRTYAVACGARINYFRTLDGSHEVDIIVSKGLPAVGIEVKMSSTIVDKDVRHLNWLEKNYGSNLKAKIIVYTGQTAYRRSSDGVIVCPAAMLGV